MGCFNYICPICNTSIRTGATSGIIAIHDRCYNQNESVQKTFRFRRPTRIKAVDQHEKSLYR